jgi:UDP-2,3-diacylglucosamine hydrolase
MSKKIAVLACFGNLPILAAKKLLELGYETHVIRVMPYCSYDYEEYANISLKIGEIGRLFEYLNHSNIREIVFAGKVQRPNLKSIKFDLVGSKLLYRVLKNKVLGDDKVLATVIDFFEENNFSVIPLSDFMKNSNDTKILTNKEPNENELHDIKVGMELIEKISEFDVGQSVIIEDGYVLGIEAAEGTDELIKRCGKLRKNKIKSGVLVKTIKKNQTFKADLPVIGVETIKNLKENNFAGIGISEEVIIVDEKLVVKLANEVGIFIYKAHKTIVGMDNQREGIDKEVEN